MITVEKFLVRTHEIQVIRVPSIYRQSYTEDLIDFSFLCRNLSFNKLTSWINGTFRSYPDLTHLFLTSNMIEEIVIGMFDGLESLILLDLSNNNINQIDPDSLKPLVKLKELDLSSNALAEVPVAIRKLPLLKEIMINKNRIEVIDEDSFNSNNYLQLIEIKGNPLKSLDYSSFLNCTRLRKIVISDGHGLSRWPNLSNANSLQHISFDRTNIQTVSPLLCISSAALKSLIVKSSRLRYLPALNNCAKLELLDFSYNQLTMIGEKHFITQSQLTHLFLSHNWIQEIHGNSFTGLENLKMLDLSNNLIKSIHPNSFLPLLNLKDLNLGANKFSSLPTIGLRGVQQIKVHNNPYLISFPGPEFFPSIQVLALSYAYHCCSYNNLIDEASSSSSTNRINHFEEDIIWLHRDDVNMSIWNTSWPNIWSTRINSSSSPIWSPETDSFLMNISQFSEEYLDDYKTEINYDNIVFKYPIKCLPQPSPFTPCEDLFDWWTLRCGVWIVFLLALLGNGVVVVVLIFGRSKLDVPRFLVCNLAMADFLMGIYLGMLAVVDAATLGQYKVYALPWQRSFGCQIAGFLGVLSTELSVYTLAVITSERNYAITHAMHLNKRLSLKHAAYIMAVGWTFALIMALLPLFGVSDYRKFAVCLPFEITDIWSRTYVISLIVVNGLAFFILMGCYLRMYCAIRGSQAWNSNDSRIAKRMALLVFTDFLCWAPIAFFTLTAIAGYELITLAEAKVFTVFVLPLNSCANPFLYAIFTKQFKKDCILLCKRIEESRVTRGIGRGRNSSNFSNRHTPVNTNSVADKKSSGDSNQLVCKCGLASTAQSTVSINKLLPNGSCNGQPLFRKMATKWWQGRSVTKDLVGKLDATDSGSVQRRSNAPNNRLDSISSGNYSSRSDSWRHSYISPQLLTTKRSAAMVRRRSSWTASSSTSTRKLSTTRSSVSSDSSSAVFRHDLKGPARLPIADDYLLTFNSKQRSNSVVSSLVNFKPSSAKATFLCPECSRIGTMKQNEASTSINVNNLTTKYGRETEKIMMAAVVASSRDSNKFFNKLTELSRKDKKDSKEKHFVLSSGESIKNETTETSLQDSIATDTQMLSSRSNSISSPLTEIQIECTDDDDFNDDYDDLFSPERDYDNSYTLYPEPESSRASSNLSIRTQIPKGGTASPIGVGVSSDAELHVDESNNLSGSRELTGHENGSDQTADNNHEPMGSNLTQSRKVSSDNSLKSPFQVIPSLFKSFSSVGSQIFRSNKNANENQNFKENRKAGKSEGKQSQPAQRYLLSPDVPDCSIRVSKSCQTMVTSENFESTLRKSCTMAQLADKNWNDQIDTLTSPKLKNVSTNMDKDDTRDLHLDEDVPLIFFTHRDA
ncbi:leucine-rich repeat-containing G-protein coupled receptor 5-like isoform X2 [Tetranychus urticae]|uniref:leucine-rich repeat-containing G-protein coupled receptor 5-like isoform X2 n=1 Tax=Tetranychus urticae TaxID=32264 RepID=UPI000D65D1E0|nr:leucine-rich repeat-containing G-protein coupled receptor 5-like isoform X2 [Tetranychus urticae]